MPATPRSATGLRRAPVVALAALVLLAGCSRQDPILPGQRIPVRPDETPVAGAPQAHPLALPPAVVNADWTHRNGSSGGRLPHPALRPVPELVWAVDLGQGSAKRTRVLVGPIVAGGLVYGIDAAGRLTAVTRSGQIAWTKSLVPEAQVPDSGPGGGMSVAGGVLFVGTGFGEIMALDPVTGGVFWRRSLEAPIRSSPTVQDGRVLLVTRDDSAYGLDARSGETLWRVQGTGGVGVLGSSSPAVAGKLAVVPFASGEVLGVLARNGLSVWGTAVTGGRPGLARSDITDISGDPVIDGSAVYASNQAGRTVRLETLTGERLWTIPEGSYGPAWPVGNSVFLVSDEGAVVRADATTGELIWQVNLPPMFPHRGFFGRGKPYAAIPYYGPILAGGRIWVAGADGLLRAFSPADGTALAQIPLPGGAAGAPAVAGGVMYVPTRDGQLLAFQ